MTRNTQLIIKHYPCCAKGEYCISRGMVWQCPLSSTIGFYDDDPQQQVFIMAFGFLRSCR